ncbi:MAG: GIY-YIG nuclease family protein [Candidatus Aminicenantia bacterium]
MTYLLLFYLEEDRFVKTGKKGVFRFNKGYYLYSGSGKRNGFQRVLRHIKSSKKKRWHIDYLISYCKIIKIWILFEENVNECFLSSGLKKLNGKILVKKFGSSDCNCLSHLFYFKENPGRKIKKNLF